MSLILQTILEICDRGFLTDLLKNQDTLDGDIWVGEGSGVGVLGVFQHAFPKFLFFQVPNSVIAVHQLWHITFLSLGVSEDISIFLRFVIIFIKGKIF